MSSTPAKKKYITVFPGVRDQYQVPELLWESKRLAFFITEFYNKGLLKIALRLLGRSAQLKKREIKDIPSSLIATRPAYVLLTRFLTLFYQPSKAAVWEDERFSKIAVSYARKYKLNLFLYEFQADYAFRQSYDFNIVKILFQFHPHPAWEHPLLLNNTLGNKEIYTEVVKNTRNNLADRYKHHTHDSWKEATHIIVASGITMHSLVYAGCPREKISIVPYGFNSEDRVLPNDYIGPELEKPYFLFVGSGTYRKGLLHLIKAWEMSGLAAAYTLLIISRIVDASIEPFLSAAGIIWKQGVPKTDLNFYYQHAVCFVMPSLSEGFGQVYLEALSNGCPVLGTRNSMLADVLQGESHIILVEPGDIRELSDQLIQVSKKDPQDHFFNKIKIRSLAEPYKWSAFRMGINKILTKFD